MQLNEKLQSELAHDKSIEKDRRDFIDSLRLQIRDRAGLVSTLVNETKAHQHHLDREKD